jgi:hypothetical protein
MSDRAQVNASKIPGTLEILKLFAPARESFFRFGTPLFRMSNAVLEDLNEVRIIGLSGVFHFKFKAGPVTQLWMPFSVLQDGLSETRVVFERPIFATENLFRLRFYPVSRTISIRSKNEERVVNWTTLLTMFWLTSLGLARMSGRFSATRCNPPYRSTKKHP